MDGGVHLCSGVELGGDVTYLMVTSRVKNGLGGRDRPQLRQRSRVGRLMLPLDGVQAYHSDSSVYSCAYLTPLLTLLSKYLHLILCSWRSIR